MCADSLLALFYNNGPTQKDLFWQENSQEPLWFHKKYIAAFASHCPLKSASCHEIAPSQRPFFDLFYWTAYPFSFRGNLLCFATHLRFFGPTIQLAFHCLPIVLATRTKHHGHEVVPARNFHYSPLQRLSSHYQRGPQDHSEGYLANQDWHVQPLCPAHVGVPDHQRKRRSGRSTGHGGGPRTLPKLDLVTRKQFLGYPLVKTENTLQRHVKIRRLASGRWPKTSS